MAVFLPPTQLLLETKTVTFCAFSSNNVKPPECITCVTGCWFPGSVQKILPLGGYGSLVSGLIHSVDLEKLQLLGWSQKFISGIEVCKYVRTGVNFHSSKTGLFWWWLFFYENCSGCWVWVDQKEFQDPCFERMNFSSDLKPPEKSFSITWPTFIAIIPQLLRVNLFSEQIHSDSL